MTPGELLRSCPSYEPAPEGRDCEPGTCLGCGGDDWEGPSCICPEFGECEDCADVYPGSCERHGGAA